MRQPGPYIVLASVVLATGALVWGVHLSSIRHGLAAMRPSRRSGLVSTPLQPKLQATDRPASVITPNEPPQPEKRAETLSPPAVPTPIITPSPAQSLPAAVIVSQQPATDRDYWRAIFDAQPPLHLSSPPIEEEENNPQEIFLTAAERELAARKPQNALAILSKIEQPNERAQADKAIAYFLATDFAHAADVFQQLSQEHPLNGSYFLGSGEMQFLLRNHKEALGQLELGQATDPSNPQFLVWIGLARARLGDWGASAESFRAALSLDSSDLKTRAWLAHALVLAGKSEAAGEVVEEALRKAPDRANFYLDLALLALNKKNVQGAIAVIRRGRVALTLDAGAKELLRSPAFALLRENGEFQIVMQSLQTPPQRELAAESSSANPSAIALVKRGDDAVKNKDVGQAIALYESAMELGVRSAELLTKLGDCYLTKREFGRAASLLERAQNLDPSYPKIYYHLGLAYQGLGWRSLAIETWKKGLIVAPQDESIRAAIETGEK